MSPMASGTMQAASQGQGAGAPEISLEKLCFSYAGRPLFQDFDLTAAAGRWTCILGPSGCGKSTLLRLISGGMPMAKGSISFDGRALAPGQVAWMAQKDLLLPWLTVLDNLTLGARLRAEPARRSSKRPWPCLNRPVWRARAGPCPIPCRAACARGRPFCAPCWKAAR